MRLPKSTALPAPSLSCDEVFAKTKVDKDGVVCLGQTLEEHCTFVGFVARELLGWWPAKFQRWFPQGTDFLVGMHDVGKMTPAFQEKLRRATDAYKPNSLSALRYANPDAEKNWGKHSGAGQVISADWTSDGRIPLIIGWHHGRFPKSIHYRADDEVFGGTAWQRERTHFVERLKKRLHSDFPVVQSDLQAKILAGLTTVSDWIGSNENWAGNNPEQAAQAVSEAGFVRPRIRCGLSFEEIFGFKPNASQLTLEKACIGPGVYVLEAAMGMGKTEAALFAAYRMMEKGQAVGIYFALPTQTTSNAICKRMNAFLNKILEKDDPIRKAMLIHGNAALVRQAMGAEAEPGAEWFAPRKRSILAPVGVGTIDQALMSVMAVTHSPVRALGLMGKVVVLDEVHSYDIYTGTLVDALVKQLRALGCTVIVLSATLTNSRREVLTGVSAKSASYPLLTVSYGTESEACEHSIEGAASKKIDLTYESRTSVAREEAIRRASVGQQVLWIENSVREAQEVYDALRTALGADSGIELGLIHSRFTVADRESNESRWCGLLGKNSPRRAACGRILVGTQVLEQSLDIDADYLVTRLSPSDMLLQRIGRLWRHASQLRPETARCEACILCPEDELLKSSPKEALGTSAIVYSPYVLCRTAEALQSRSFIRIPDDVRELLEETYQERDENGIGAELLRELDEGTKYGKGRRALRQMAQLTMAETLGELDDDENVGATRYCQIPSVEVLILRRFEKTEEKILIETFSGDRIEINCHKKCDYQERVKKALIFMKNCVRVPVLYAPKACAYETLSWLSPYLPVRSSSRSSEAKVMVCVVAENGRLEYPSGEPVCINGDVFYDEMGYRLLKSMK